MIVSNIGSSRVLREESNHVSASDSHRLDEQVKRFSVGKIF